MVYKPKEIPEGVNVTSVHPLVNFAYLLGTVVVFSGLVYLGLGAIATQLATRISPELEAKIGRELISDIPHLDRESNSPKQQYLEELLTSLQKSNVNSYTPLTIYVQKSKISNAAILPGGHIIITTTLLEEAESENELAFVIAHELGHHIARDHLKGLGRSLVLLTVASVLGVGGGNANIVGITGSLTNLHYSRQQESTADLYALSAIVDYYGHGDASLDFFNRIQTKNKDKRGEFSAYFSTHPLTQKRINYLHQFAKKKGWKMKGEIKSLPNNIFD
ncbi:M48 family metallopeptidase [Waterburya agarophytonicola K14]|uniref:M48 family metallopeptidase n=1 Tax=Waterburya agarophytonicola KI4 TaxID=2874699 RepID=A0A964FFA0_9CYAN|nr:M48 family metallopeptidase [Waterburya agarophytonicola]MCC0176742.1 M48 family metallopeptidase [Waterburya agarophytonicola KI4]